jgi:hypothetical protein
VQTPRFCGQDFKAGDFVLDVIFFRPERTNWLIVGIRQKLLISQQKSRFDEHNSNTSPLARSRKTRLEIKIYQNEKKRSSSFEKKIEKNSPVFCPPSG